MYETAFATVPEQVPTQAMFVEGLVSLVMRLSPAHKSKFQ